MSVLASPSGRQRSARVLLDVLALSLVMGAMAHLTDPEILFNALWVTLAVGAFVFSLRAALARIALGTLFIVGFMLNEAQASGGPVDLEDLAVVPLLLTITLIVTFMAHRARTTARRYATLYRVASERLLTAQEEERTRLSRDLHDSLGQTLTAAALALDVAEGDLASTPPRTTGASASIGRARSLVTTSLEQAHQVALQLRPTRIHEVGLGASIHSLADAAGLRVDVRFAPSMLPSGALHPEQEIGLFRIVQEALANVARHSRAARAWVDAAVTRDEVSISIGDDGIGFDDGAAGPGLGLVGMQERAEILQGRLRIRSHPGAGTTVTVVIPRLGLAAPAPTAPARVVVAEELG